MSQKRNIIFITLLIGALLILYPKIRNIIRGYNALQEVRISEAIFNELRGYFLEAVADFVGFAILFIALLAVVEYSAFKPEKEDLNALTQ